MQQDPHKAIDALIKKDTEEKQKDTVKKDTKNILTQNLEKVRDNIRFAQKIEDEPVLSNEFDKNVFNCKVISFSNYIAQLAWPSSIYSIDKIVRLNVNASLEWQKRFLAKKRSIPLNMLWFFLIIVVIVVVIAVVWMLLPRYL